MRLSRPTRAILGGVACAVLTLQLAPPAHALLDHTSIYGWLVDYLCGEDWTLGDGTSCLDRDPPLSENDIADLAGELLRLEAISSGEDQIEETQRIEIDFFRLCEAEPARCLGWLKTLSRKGSLDGDMDGVLDGADQCPGTPTVITRAQSILLAQDTAYLELRDIWDEIRSLLLSGLNGTLGSNERFYLGEELIPLFNDLYALANKQVDGRFLFGGLLDDSAPFERSGSFLDPEGPTVAYRGSTEALALPIGPVGELTLVASPGSRLFLGDIDSDGVYPDAPARNMFQLIVRFKDLLQNFDRALLWEEFAVLDETLAFQLFDAQVESGRAFSLTKRIYPSRERSEVDFAGCSQTQFCANVLIESRNDRRVCAASDFLNDEPLKKSPRDCVVRRIKKTRHCEAAAP